MKWEKERLAVPSWCSGCDRWTYRDRLPGTSTNYGPIPDWYFCTGCGWWDAAFIEEHEGDVA